MFATCHDDFNVLDDNNQPAAAVIWKKRERYIATKKQYKQTRQKYIPLFVSFVVCCCCCLCCWIIVQQQQQQDEFNKKKITVTYFNTIDTRRGERKKTAIRYYHCYLAIMRNWCAPNRSQQKRRFPVYVCLHTTYERTNDEWWLNEERGRVRESFEYNQNWFEDFFFNFEIQSIFGIWSVKIVDCSFVFLLVDVIFVVKNLFITKKYSSIVGVFVWPCVCIIF